MTISIKTSKNPNQIKDDFSINEPIDICTFSDGDAKIDPLKLGLIYH